MFAEDRISSRAKAGALVRECRCLDSIFCNGGEGGDGRFEMRPIDVGASKALPCWFPSGVTGDCKWQDSEAGISEMVAELGHGGHGDLSTTSSTPQRCHAIPWDTAEIPPCH